MATDAYFQCTACNHYEYPPSMFAGLLVVAEAHVEPCPDCRSKRIFQLDFSFATDEKPRRCRVRAAFTPSGDDRPRWKQGRELVEFFPFLVVLEQLDYTDDAVWLPYWHIKRRRSAERTLYGQWAPFMDQSLFAELTRRARVAGFIE